MSQGPTAAHDATERLKLVTFGDLGLHVEEGQGLRAKRLGRRAMRPAGAWYSGPRDSAPHPRASAAIVPSG